MRAHDAAVLLIAGMAGVGWGEVAPAGPGSGSGSTLPAEIAPTGPGYDPTPPAEVASLLSGLDSVRTESGIQPLVFDPQWSRFWQDGLSGHPRRRHEPWISAIPDCRQDVFTVEAPDGRTALARLAREPRFLADVLDAAVTHVVAAAAHGLHVVCLIERVIGVDPVMSALWLEEDRWWVFWQGTADGDSVAAFAADADTPEGRCSAASTHPLASVPVVHRRFELSLACSMADTAAESPVVLQVLREGEWIPGARTRVRGLVAAQADLVVPPQHLR
ncbi:MAG: hypothetical protein R6X25_11055 [Candidatus Krumholzibacteriia bacterium]